MNKGIAYKYILDLRDEINEEREGKIGIEDLSKLIANKINRMEIEESDDRDKWEEIREMFAEIKIAEDYDNAMNELIGWCERGEDGINGEMMYRCKLSIQNIKTDNGEKPKEGAVLGVKRDEYDSEWFNLFLDGQTLRIENDRVKWVIDKEQLSPIALVSKEREKYYDRKFNWVTNVTVKGTKESINTLLYNIGVGTHDKEVEPKWRQKGQYEL